MEQKKILSSLCVLSIALIAFELFVINTFSVGNWANFGSLVISTALLGFGVSGTILTFLTDRVRRNAHAWLYGSSLLFVLTMALSHILGQIVPFNPIFIGSKSKQLLWIGIYYINYGVPFFFGSLFIGSAFIALDTKIHKLYFWNMFGSGVGGFFLILLMFFLSPAGLIVPILVLGLTANLIVGAERDPEFGRTQFPLAKIAVSVAAAAVTIGVTFFLGDIRVSEYKPINYVRKYPDAVEVHHSYSPTGEMHVYASSYFHFAPGLSDNAVFAMDELPTQPFWGLFIDGNGPIGIMGEVDRAQAVYMDYTPMAAAYTILDKPKNLLVNLGGGINAQVARYKGAEQVVIYEENPEIVSLMRDDPVVSRFTGNLLEDEMIDVRIGEARAHCAGRPDSYDLVEISLIDSIGLSDSGGYSIHENYTYTAEAVREYMYCLREDGLLSVTVWNRLNPPRNVLKLMSTIIASLREQGVERPEDRIYMFDLFLSTATILVKNSDFTREEIEKLNSFCETRSFEILYYPGIERRNIDLDTVMRVYRDHFENNSSVEENVIFTPGDVYHLMLMEMLEGDVHRLYDKYVFDIRPVRDSRPYYSGYLKLGEIGMYLDQIQDVSEEWAFLLNLGILIQAVFFGFLVILIPILGRWKALFQKKRGTFGVIMYYSCLGLGYMLVEIFLIQRLIFLLSNPIFSTSIVITSMLIISGIGNLASSRIARRRVARVRVAAIGIFVSMLFYFFLLGPVMSTFREAVMPVRILVAILVVAPGAFFLGMPFPNGLSALTEHRNKLLPWAWGMNGGLSVAGAALAQVVSVSFGFPVVLLIVMFLYIVVGVFFPANEQRSIFAPE